MSPCTLNPTHRLVAPNAETARVARASHEDTLDFPFAPKLDFGSLHQWAPHFPEDHHFTLVTRCPSADHIGAGPTFCDLRRIDKDGDVSAALAMLREAGLTCGEGSPSRGRAPEWHDARQEGESWQAFLTEGGATHIWGQCHAVR